MTKKSSKEKIDRLMITPEYIAEKRLERQLKKAERLAKGDGDDKAPASFIKRPLLMIPGQSKHTGLKISVMSYNMLAQSLIRKDRFPTSGLALRWSHRSDVLLAEFKHYDCDILCLQEVDSSNYDKFWKAEMAKLGYQSKYHKSDEKTHGIAIFYKKELFVGKECMSINFDKEDTGAILNSTTTLNVGLMVYLEFTQTVLDKNPLLSRDGIIIGTTHLFWHPFGTYERSRQTYIVLKKMKEFSKLLDLLRGGQHKYYRFFAGDFNSQPYDTPYLSITAKPIRYTNRAKIVIGRSIVHDWKSREARRNKAIKNAASIENHETVSPSENMQSESDIGNDKDGAPQEAEKNKLDDNPVPDNFSFSEQTLDNIHQMENLHNELDMRAISLYSVGYHLVHKENAGLDNDRGEPFFSNWAETWKGLLDYIFVVDEWDKAQSFADKADSLKDLENNNHVKLLGLLRLPVPEEMEPSGQPKVGQYPSDHLCIIAEVELV